MPFVLDHVAWLAYQWMPNHGHLVLRADQDCEMSRFLRWMSATHTMRYHAHDHTSGQGHVYQGRFTSFPIQEDEHFFVVCRYVERNALRAGLVARAEKWRWGSLWRGLRKPEPEPQLLSAWPIPRWRGWTQRFNEPLTDRELESVRQSVPGGSRFGEPSWIESSSLRLGLESTLRPRGRPHVGNIDSRPNKESGPLFFPPFLPPLDRKNVADVARLPRGFRSSSLIGFQRASDLSGTLASSARSSRKQFRKAIKDFGI